MSRPSDNGVPRARHDWRGIIVDEFGEDFADGYDAWVRAEALWDGHAEIKQRKCSTASEAVTVLLEMARADAERGTEKRHWQRYIDGNHCAECAKYVDEGDVEWPADAEDNDHA